MLLLDVDRCQLIRLPPRAREADVTHSWAVDGVPPVRPKSIAEAFPWLIGRVRAGHAVVLRRIDDLPPEAEVDKASFWAIGTRSNLSMPLKVAGRVEGLLAFGCLRRERDWPEELVERIGILATVFGNALAHKRAQESLDAAMTFERTVSEVLGALLTAARAGQDRVIEAGLRDMARVFGVQRATLWERIGDKVEFRKTHRWLAEGVPVPPDSSGAVAIPWISAQLAAGSVVRFARHADLPPEAAADLPRLQALNIRAAVIVPFAVSGEVVGALSFATAREDHEWPEELIARVGLFGEVFAGVLARQAAERREQEAQAQAAHAARVGTMGVFAASLVHELTQPLAASLANAETVLELLAAPSPDLQELRATAADIVADDRRAGELIQQLRRFLRRGEVQRTELDLREVVDEVLRLAGGEVAEKGVAVSLDLPEGLPKFVADRVQIQQVLLNLLLNAFDAVAANEPGARSVAVRAWPTGSGVSVEVIDSGRGMDEATLARIFETLLHHQAARDGTRTLDQPDDRFGPRRHADSALDPGSRHRAPHRAARAAAGRDPARTAGGGPGDRQRHRLRDRRRPVDVPSGRTPAPGRWVPGRDVRLGAGVPRPGAARRRRLHRERRAHARAERPRPAGFARAGEPRAADRVHQRSRRRYDHGARDAGRRGQLPGETVHQERSPRRGGGGARARPRARGSPKGTRRFAGPLRIPDAARAGGPRGSWRQGCSTSSSPTASALPRRPSRSIAAASWRRWGAVSVANLVGMAERLGLQPAPVSSSD